MNELISTYTTHSKEKEPAPAPEDVQTSAQFVDALKAQFIDRMWVFMAIVATPLLPMSSLRVIRTGWLVSYSVHWVLWAVILGMALFRKRLSIRFKVGMLGAMLLIAAATGLRSFGLLGMGVWSAVFGASIVGVAYSYRAALAMFFCLSVTIGGALVAYRFGGYTPLVDPVVYAQSWAPWVIMLIFATAFPALLMSGFAIYQGAIINLLSEIEAQRNSIAQHAYYDDLTELPTRRLAYDRLRLSMSRSQREGSLLAVCFIDLDGFKAINDAHNHQFGDEVLRHVAQHLNERTRSSDTLARLGGDEFLLLLNDLQSEADARQVVNGLIERISEPMQVRDHRVQLGASVGIAMYPEHDLSAEELVHAADKAMYQAKRQGKGRAHFYCVDP